MKTTAFVLLAAVAACSPYRIMPVRSGALYASRGAGCTVEFQNLNFQEASAKYDNLGLISLTGTSGDEFTPAMKKDVEQAACKMGGDHVTLNASAPGIFQFIVWRSR